MMDRMEEVLRGLSEGRLSVEEVKGLLAAADAPFIKGNLYLLWS